MEGFRFSKPNRGPEAGHGEFFNSLASLEPAPIGGEGAATGRLQAAMSFETLGELPDKGARSPCPLCQRTCLIEPIGIGSPPTTSKSSGPYKGLSPAPGAIPGGLREPHASACLRLRL